MKKLFIVLLLFTGTAQGQWNLIWSDEFDGSQLDGSKWIQETGGNGWGNNESQFYTSGSNNLNFVQGQLIITARKEQFGSNAYTSAKISTKGKFSTRYGKIESRILCPQGKGLWPACWMLGTSIDQVSWPACGEIDIMEHINSEMKIHGTAHWDNMGHQYWGGVIANDPAIFHDYSIIWDSTKIRWYMDGTLYYQLNIANGVNGTEEFQAPFYLILNLAVGGNWPGYPDQTTVFPAEMKVDYIRVYEADPTASIIQPITQLELYPNPASDQLIIHSDDPVYSYKLLTSDGRLLEQTTNLQPISSITLSSLFSGSYIVELNFENYVVRKRFVKN